MSKKQSNKNYINTYEDRELSPQEYFNKIKSLKKNITDKELDDIYENCLELANKYCLTGQVRALRKILFCMECIEKEKKIIDMGINTFIYRDDIDFYMDNITSKNKQKPIKLIELERYEREIPDKIVEVIEKTKDIFDQMYIVYTDYTQKAEKVIKAEKKQKDPILFGTFQSREKKVCIDRFYYLGDWVDEYCDLTLDKMIKRTENIGRNIVRTIQTPQDIEQLKKYLDSHYELENGKINSFIRKADKDVNYLKNIFSSIKTFLTRR